MDFTVPSSLQELLFRVQTFIEQEVYPLEPEVAARGFRALLPDLTKVRLKVKKEGLWCPPIPKSHGGMGLSVSEHALVSEVLGRSPLGHYAFNCQAPDAGNMEILIRHGTAEQRQSFLEPLLAGEVRSSFAMTEPGRPGSNPVWLDTTAVKDGNDYVLNGRKWFATAAEGAAFAIVMAITDPAAASPYERASLILVPTNAAGFKRVRNLPLLGHVGEDFDSHGEVVFDNCRVPQKNRLGPEGAGFRIAQERLGAGRIHHSMRWIGIGERSLELMCRRAVSRELSPGEPLGRRQIVQQWIAESRAELTAARLSVLHAAWKVDRFGQDEAREEISCIKFYVAEVMLKVVDRAIQVHGASGLTHETPLATFFRNERGARIYDGPDEVHKMVVARRLLKKHGLANP